MTGRVVRALGVAVLLSLLPMFMLMNLLSSNARGPPTVDIPATKYFNLSERIVQRIRSKDYDAVAKLLLDQRETVLGSSPVSMDPSKSSVVRIEEKTELPKQPMNVLLLSSTPRSGSSFVGELLATHNASVYFFEPMHKLQQTTCIESDQCVSQYLKNLFQCRIDDYFSKWLKAKKLFISFYNKETRNCASKPEKERAACVKSINLTQACEASQVRIVKVIRARLSQVESLLADDSLNLQVIHLYRDPRGFMKSINKFRDWIKDPNYYCSGLNDDLNYSVSLYNRYPHKVLQVSYERISQSPTEYAELMFNFAFGSLTLPRQTEQYIATHTQQQERDKGKDVMSRTRDSSKAYQDWRDKISLELLRAVETNNNCRDSINIMKNRLFGDLKSVRDKNLSMFLD